MSHQHDIIIFNTTNAYPKLFTTPAYTTPESFTPPTETSDEFTPPPKISYDITPPSTKIPIGLTPTLRRYQRIFLQNHQPRLWTTSHFQQPRLRKIVHNAQNAGAAPTSSRGFSGLRFCWSELEPGLSIWCKIMFAGLYLCFCGKQL